MAEKLVDQELVKELSKVFDKLVSNKMATQSMIENKAAIVDSMAKNLTGKVSASDVKEHPLVRSRVMGAMICKGMGLGNMDKHFNNALERNPKSRMSDLDRLCLMVYSFLKLKLQADKNENKNEKKLELTPKSLAEKIMNAYKKHILEKDAPKNRNPKDEKLFEQRMDQETDNLTKTLEMYFGGDPRQPGRISNTAASAAVISCEPSWSAPCIPDPNNKSNWVDQHTFNSDRMDYTGNEANSLIDDIAIGTLTKAEADFLEPSPKHDPLDPDQKNESSEHKPISPFSTNPFSTSNRRG